MRPRAAVHHKVIVGLFALWVAVGCTGSGERPQLLVAAAASLSDAFSEIETTFEESHPEIDVLVNYAGSSTLREQILGGAPVDVFASANMVNMDAVTDAGLAAGEPQTFAHNRLQIAVPTGNPAGITGLEDFSREDAVLGLCAEGVPCGDLAREALAAAGVEPNVDTNEPHVRSLLTKVEVGELDAGIVYVSDVVAAGGAVEGIDIPDEHNVSARYPIVVLAHAPHPDASDEFVGLVPSPEGQEILEAHGLITP